MPVPVIALSAVDAGIALGVSADTIERLVAAGHLARVPHLGHIRIAVAELDRFATSTMPNQQPGAAA